MSSHAVRGLFAAFGKEPDETLSAYLISILEDAEAELLDLVELQDVVSSFSSSFSSLPQSEQRGLLVQLVKQVNKAALFKQHQQATPEADEAETQQAEQHRQQPGPLLELYPGCSQAFLHYVLHDICHDRLEDAAHWLMDQDNLERSEASWHARREQLQRDAEQAARQEKANRKQLLDKYHLQAVPTSAHADIHTRSKQAPKSKNQVRYREGQIVTAKGEKYVVEKLGPDWDGGSSGKVVTKGKRGKGFVQALLLNAMTQHAFMVYSTDGSVIRGINAHQVNEHFVGQISEASMRQPRRDRFWWAEQWNMIWRLFGLTKLVKRCQHIE